MAEGVYNNYKDTNLAVGVTLGSALWVARARVRGVRLGHLQWHPAGHVAAGTHGIAGGLQVICPYPMLMWRERVQALGHKTW